MRKTYLLFVLAAVATIAVVALTLVGRTGDGPPTASEPRSAPSVPLGKIEALRQSMTPVPCPTSALDPGILATPLHELDIESFDAGIQAPTPANPDQFTLLSNADRRCFVGEFAP